MEVPARQEERVHPCWACYVGFAARGKDPVLFLILGKFFFSWLTIFSPFNTFSPIEDLIFVGFVTQE